MKKNKNVLFSTMLIGLCGLIAPVAVSRARAADAKPMLSRAGASGATAADAPVKIGPATRRRLGIVVKTLPSARYKKSWHVVGYTRSNAGAVYTVRAAVGGTLRAAKQGNWPRLGQEIKRRMLLGAIIPRTSPSQGVQLATDIARAAEEKATAGAALAAAKAQYTRDRLLYKESQNVSLAAVQQAKAAFMAQKIHVAAATKELAFLRQAMRNGTGPTAPTALRVVAGGQVTAIMAQPGEVVRRGQIILRLVDRRLALAELALPRALAGSPPTTAMLQVRGWKPMQAKFSGLALRADRVTRRAVALYRFQAPNAVPSRLVVRAVLTAPGAAVVGECVPAGAVVWVRGKPWVYVSTGPNTFRRVPISVADPMPGGFFVSAKTLEKGRPLVAGGAQMLLSIQFHRLIKTAG